MLFLNLINDLMQEFQLCFLLSPNQNMYLPSGFDTANKAHTSKDFESRIFLFLDFFILDVDIASVRLLQSLLPPKN